MGRHVVAGSLVLLVTAISAQAQWLDHRTVGIPRSADGKPVLDGPAPKLPDGTPDLSGLWNAPLQSAYVADITTDLPPGSVRPAAAKLFEERLSEFGKDDPATIGCLPSGPRHIIGGPTASPVRIVQSPTTIIMAFEGLTHRQVHLDGRRLPENPNPSFMGYSVGRWEGDTLIVDTVGFNGRTWLDFGGHPHGERLRTVERWRRISFGRIERQVTLIDDEFYTQPIVLQLPMTFAADTDMLEYVCADMTRATRKGVSPLERGSQVHPMGEFQSLLDFPPAPKLTILGRLDAARSSEAERRGEALFFGKAQCSTCHVPPYYTDNLMHNLRTERFFNEVTINGRKASADGPIKTFPLRGIKDSPPYLHDDRLMTLDDTVEFFNLVLGLKLTAQEKQDITAFMRAL